MSITERIKFGSDFGLSKRALKRKIVVEYRVYSSPALLHQSVVDGEGHTFYLTL